MSSVLNTEILDQLREILGEDFGLIIDSFHQEGGNLISNMQAASTSGDFQQMKEAAHSMKSMSGNVGAMELSGLSDQLQIASANEDQAKVDELWPLVKSQYDSAVIELSQLSS